MGFSAELEIRTASGVRALQHDRKVRRQRAAGAASISVPCNRCGSGPQNSIVALPNLKE
jgi:hypothetical protein